jgi:hypothetical protein
LGDAEGCSLGIVLLAAVFLANVPESLGSAGAMREEGRSRGYIIGVCTGVAVVCVLATIAGYRSWLTIRPSRKPVSSAKTLPGTKRGCAGLRGRLPRGVAAAEAANPALRPRPSVNHDAGRVEAMAVSKGRQPAAASASRPVARDQSAARSRCPGEPPAGQRGLVTRLARRAACSNARQRPAPPP